jgi:hypothetical protein
MLDALWTAGVIFANLWASTGFGDIAIVRKMPYQIEDPPTPFIIVGERGGFTDLVDSPQKSQDTSRTPILPPLKANQRCFCEDAPDGAEILRALPKLASEVSRDDMEFTVEKLVDRVDAPRFFPLIGPAQLHHCHWKCTVYYTKRDPKKRCAEVVYVDKDHLHLCAYDSAKGWSKPSPRVYPDARARFAETQPPGTLSQTFGSDSTNMIDSQNARLMRDQERRIWMKAQPAQQPIVLAGHTEESAQPPRSKKMSLADIVKLSKRGIADDIIVRQMELTGSTFALTVEDILYLNEQGVSDGVLRGMQKRR